MRIAYFDCFAGAAGNMILGALVDAGLSLDALERELRRLPVSGWTIRATPVRKHGLGALYLDVDVPGEDDHHVHTHDHHDHHGEHRDHHHHHDHHDRNGHRTLADVLAILRAADFPQTVEKTAAAIYQRLGEAEARVHRVPLQEIAFHEVGQIDAIVDIAGAAIGLHLLGIERVYSSALPCGHGRIEAAHGVMPSPAPATLELLRGVPSYDVDVDGELVTPTGAAILTAIAAFEPRPEARIERVGYGSGRSDFPFPNVLRVEIGETIEAKAERSAGPAHVVMLETNIDDMNPQLYDHVLERLFAAGALDAWTQSIVMKKGRPAVTLSALAEHERAGAVTDVMLSETTTLGVRRFDVVRTVLAREVHTIDTQFGPVRIKVAKTPAGVRAQPEYEDCLAIARRDGRTLHDVMRALQSEAAAWLQGTAR